MICNKCKPLIGEHLETALDEIIAMQIFLINIAKDLETLPIGTNASNRIILDLAKKCRNYSTALTIPHDKDFICRICVKDVDK